MTQEEYLKEMEWFANGERCVPEAFFGAPWDIYSHFHRWEVIQNELNEGDHAIELGCGCGITPRIYALRTKRPFVALDKLEVIEMAELLYPTPGIEYYAADFNEHWAYDYGVFDIVICTHVIEHIKEKDLFLSELAKLAHNNTRYILDVPIGEDDNSFHIHHWESKEEFIDDVSAYIPRESIVMP